MKPTKLDVATQQLSAALLSSGSAAPALRGGASGASGPDDPSQSGIRAAILPPAAALAASEVTVVFRRAMPTERLVQLIRRMAREAAPSTPLCVEVEQLSDTRRWSVRVQSADGELAASESGPFLAVTRAFALLQQHGFSAA